SNITEIGCADWGNEIGQACTMRIHHSIHGNLNYRRTVTSIFVIPFTPLYIAPLPFPTPSATPAPVTRRPPTVTPLANHPWQVSCTITSLGKMISSSPVNCPLSTYPGRPAPSIPADGLS